ncbi:MAG: trehalose-phosphatase [Deltaproteobacteria bacterium HGW-Deltaproteobacteria-21]|nr:MAG: trehalose-phosphatase [Deltaproteobacteria bacterium HGW-Deltaproteobacteria-21]
MRDVVSLPSAVESIEEIRIRARDRQLLVSLDYDGTLTPIVERPEKAVLSEEMRRILSKLADLCTVAVITGRDLSDIKRLVGLEQIYYAGSHGFDILAPGDRHVFQTGTEFLPILDRVQKALHEMRDSVPGVLIERKRFSVAVHYRNVEAGSIRVVEQAVDRVLEDQQGLRKARGKKVFELQPEVDWHKGKALMWLLEGLDCGEVLPFFVGDDVTDEDVFQVLQGCGIGIVVRDDAAMEGPLQSAARYALENQEQVGVFLQMLIEMLREREG